MILKRVRNIKHAARKGCCTPLIGRQKQADLLEFEASLVFRASSRTGKATERNLSQKKRGGGEEGGRRERGGVGK